MRGVAIAILVGGCSINNLDLSGKPCPCPASGWVCQAGTCEAATIGDARAPDSNHMRDSSTDGTLLDGLEAVSCLQDPMSSPYYVTTTFSDFGSAWTAIGPTWSVSNNELDQSSTTAQLPYAYHTVGPADYRIVSGMHELGGGDGDALEIAFRIDPTTTSMYHCNWEPLDGAFLIDHTDNGVAGSGNVLNMTTIDLQQVTDPKTVVMEVQTSGSNFQCCLRGIQGAYLVATDTLYPTGAVGLKTYEMSGTFYDFAIYD